MTQYMQEAGAMKQLTDERILEIAHRTATTYAHRSDPKYHSYGFVAHTLLDFARKLLAANEGTLTAGKQGGDGVPEAARPSMVDQIRASTEYVSWFPIKPAVRPCDKPGGCNAGNCLGCGERSPGVPETGPICGNCDTEVPPGCSGLFKDDGTACALNRNPGVPASENTQQEKPLG